MIDFNRPAFTGKETDYIKQAVMNHKLCGDGEFTNLDITLLKAISPGKRDNVW